MTAASKTPSPLVGEGGLRSRPDEGSRRATRIAAALAALTLAAAAAQRAQALCIYNGVDNARTTVRQEFRDSKWVVRARVLSAHDDFSDTNGWWTTYRIQVQRAYKGRPPRVLIFFTTRDSGGFYLDKPWVSLPEGHDVGGSYLLFLNPMERRRGEPAEVGGTVFVNYSCGVSKPWKEVSGAELRELEQLAGRSASSEPPRAPTSPERGRGSD